MKVLLSESKFSPIFTSTCKGKKKKEVRNLICGRGWVGYRDMQLVSYKIWGLWTGPQMPHLEGKGMLHLSGPLAFLSTGMGCPSMDAILIHPWSYTDLEFSWQGQDSEDEIHPHHPMSPKGKWVMSREDCGFGSNNLFHLRARVAI